MRFLYEILISFFYMMMFPYMLLSRKWHGGMWQRLGFFPKAFKARLQQNENFWIHAVSVGEVLALSEFLKAVQQNFPAQQIVLSTVTRTGYQVAQSHCPRGVVVIYAPLEWRCVLKKFLRLIKPRIYVSTETEIWPNLYFALHQQGVPLAVINGRISDKSLRRYQRFSFFLKKVLVCVDVFCVQSRTDADRLTSLGADPLKVMIVGNMKFDGMAGDAPQKLSRQDIRLEKESLVWVAGSTHPGEEVVLLNHYIHLQSAFSSLRLIIAPRHIERIPEITQIVTAKGYRPVFLTGIEGESFPLGQRDVILVDTIGQLKAMYALADIVFVGKSLLGKGGQNIIEPAVFAKAIVVGPHTQNFRSVMEMFLKENAIIQVSNSDELLRAVQTLIQNPHNRSEMGHRAQQVVLDNQGVTFKTLTIISQMISSPR